jgi:hypothetical protein
MLLTRQYLNEPERRKSLGIGVWQNYYITGSEGLRRCPTSTGQDFLGDGRGREAATREQ